MAVVNERIGLSQEGLAGVTRLAAEHGLEALPFRPTKAGGNYPFQRPDGYSPWVFVIDWHWRKGWVRFHKKFIPRLEQANLIVDREATRNCSVRYSDFRQALRICI